MKGTLRPPPAAGAEARWQALLRTADASVLRALKLAGITSAAGLLATTDLQFLQLPRVGKAVLRGLQELKQALADRSTRRGQQQVTRSITLELEPALEWSLLARAAESGLAPAQWLQQAVRRGLAAGAPLDAGQTADPGPAAAELPPAGKDGRVFPLGEADPEVVRALGLAGARTVRQLAALADWQLLELPGVGVGALRKVRALKRSLGLPADLSRARGPRGASYSFRVEFEAGRLSELAAAAGVSPWTWLRRVLLESLRPRTEAVAAAPSPAQGGQSGAE